MLAAFWASASNHTCYTSACHRPRRRGDQRVKLRLALVWPPANSHGTGRAEAAIGGGGGQTPRLAQCGSRGSAGPSPPLKSLLRARSATMAVLAALLRGGARGPSPLLRRQMQVRGAGTRDLACGLPGWEGSRLRPRGGALTVGLRRGPSAAPASRKPPAQRHQCPSKLGALVLLQKRLRLRGFFGDGNHCFLVCWTVHTF